jgi:hypothetical protein
MVIIVPENPSGKGADGKFRASGGKWILDLGPIEESGEPDLASIRTVGL